MAERIQLELVSPERLVLSDAFQMVVIPGVEGNFGVLRGHAPLISTIRPGVIEIYEGRAIVGQIFVVGGIAEVTPQRCTVLADGASALKDLDRNSVQAELQIVEGKIPILRDQGARATGTDRQRLLAEIEGLEREQMVLRAKVEALTTRQ